jgi:hypothetical protein
VIIYCDSCHGRSSPNLAIKILRGKQKHIRNGTIQGFFFFRCKKCYDLIRFPEMYEEFTQEEYMIHEVMDS